MESSFYFKLAVLDTLSKSQPPPGETIEGIVFMQGHDPNGGPLLFPFLRVRREDGSYYLRETDDASIAGCPYPPPCT